MRRNEAEIETEAEAGFWFSVLRFIYGRRLLWNANSVKLTLAIFPSLSRSLALSLSRSLALSLSLSLSLSLFSLLSLLYLAKDSFIYAHG